MQKVYDTGTGSSLEFHDEFKNCHGSEARETVQQVGLLPCMQPIWVHPWHPICSPQASLIEFLCAEVGITPEHCQKCVPPTNKNWHG